MINFGVTELKRHDLERRMLDCGLLENDIEEKVSKVGNVRKV